ncbi:MAG TPA: bifunctional ornithine acetyltransferase/N-acetylglutamate synthase, partial [Terriglobia bacterium]|nr:bifunctional ornithine acetyltransferase/N-acetylglutamate synthase [Terriglobia bacterium]
MKTSEFGYYMRECAGEPAGDKKVVPNTMPDGGPDACEMTIGGFKTSAVAAGIKADGVLDLALIYSDRPATAAAVFTKNTFIAAPLVVSKKHL